MPVINGTNASETLNGTTGDDDINGFEGDDIIYADEGDDTVDAGFFVPVNVGDFVFYDNDRDGVQDADEDGVEGVTVELVSAGDDGVLEPQMT